MIRTLQQKIVRCEVTLGIDVLRLCRVHRHRGPARRAPGAIAGAFGYWRETGRFVVFGRRPWCWPPVASASRSRSRRTRGSTPATATPWRCAGATLLNMEFVQFHPTGMVWPPSVKGILVTESVRGDGGVLRNSDGKRFMFDYIPEFFKAETADTEEEADRWYDDRQEQPSATRAAAARRGRPRDQLRGQGRPRVAARRRVPRHRLAAHAGVHPARLPSMYHQFKELADVDITAEPMEVGPTCHYVMGGVEVDADTAASPGARAVRRGRGRRRHARLEPARRQLAVRPAGVRPARRGRGRGIVRAPGHTPGRIDRSRCAAASRGTGPLRSRGWREPVHDAPGTAADDERPGRHHPQARGDGAGARNDSWNVKARARNVSVEGHRQFNPGWHLALDLQNMLIVVSECVARAALLREESRGGHTRDDYPAMRSKWRQKNLVCSTDAADTDPIGRATIPAIRMTCCLFDRDELSKYLTEAELPDLPRAVMT